MPMRSCARGYGLCLRNDVLHDGTCDVCQSKIATTVWIGQSFMVQAQQVQYRRMQVVYVDFVLDRGEAEIV